MKPLATARALFPGKPTLKAILCVAALLATSLAAQSQPPAGPSSQTPTVSFARLPLHFEPNQEQSDSKVKFIARGRGYTLLLSSTEAVLRLTDEAGAPSVIRLKLVGANPKAKVTGLDELPGKSNYFLGNDPKQWRTGVPHYARVRFEQVYPGIDLIYYGTDQRQLEYDFVVAPGADPARIKLALEGAEDIELDRGGDLLIHPSGVAAPGHEVRLLKPTVYQEQGSNQLEVVGGYVLDRKNRVTFALGGYDTEKTVVIDPVVAYASFLGGNNYDYGNSIAVDTAGNAYVAGATVSSNFPTTPGAYDRVCGIGSCDLWDAFVTKVNSNGSALVYSTYLGGIDNDRANAIAVDGAGNAYVTGETKGTDFPTVNAVQSVAGGAGNYDAFVTKLNSSGSALVYSSYLGGAPTDKGYAIAVDSTGSAYVTGQTGGGLFPLANPFQGTKGGFDDVFISKFTPTGTSLVYSSFLGGSGYDWGKGIAVDAGGNAYVAGCTDSTNFPTANPLQANHGGGHCSGAEEDCGDAFVTKLNASGTALSYSTYLGGSSDDGARSIAVDAVGNAYVLGVTESTNFPTTPSAFQPTFGGGLADDFVAKLDPIGTALVFSTYFDTASGDGKQIAVDGAGRVTLPLGLSPAQGATITKLNHTGSGVVFSTNISNGGYGRAIAIDPDGAMYVVGQAGSSFTTTPGVFQPIFGGWEEAFLAKVSLVPAINPGGAVNGASFTPGAALAPGGITAVFGTNLASGTEYAGAVPLPTMLGGANMICDGTQAVPKFFASPFQINIQLPWELAGHASASITDTVGGMTSSNQTVALAPFAPGIFAANAQGFGQGAILIANTPFLSAPTGAFPGSRPAVRGTDFLEIYWTGGGPVTPPVATGAAASASPLSVTTSTPTVIIGGVPATVLFSGLAPGYVGLYVATLQVPANAPTGNAVPVVLTIGGAMANTVTIAIQ